jgi:nucleotide-binding universal stress UspA family protein
MTALKLLLPYNYNQQDEKALDFVIRTFARRGDTGITLFHAYTPVPEIAMKKDPVMERMRENLSYLSQTVSERKEALEAACRRVAQHGAGQEQVRMVYRPRKKDIAGEIIHLAMEEAFHVVVLNRNPGKVLGFFTGSVFSKVVTALNGVTVCVVS